MNQNNRPYTPLNTFRTVLGIIFGVVLLVGLVFVSKALKEVEIVAYIGYASFIISIIILIVNIVLLAKRSKQLKTFKLEEKYNSILNYKEEVKDFNKVYTQIKKEIKISNVYVFLVFALHLITFTCLSARGDYHIALIIIPAFLILDIVSAIFNRLKESVKFYKNQINSYPYIKSIIEKCKNKLGVKDEIALTFTFDCNIGVFKIGKKTILNIGIYDLLKVNEKELESIIFHEMAHVYNEDTLVTYKVLKSTYIIKNLNNIFISFGLNMLYFAYMGNILGENLEMFLHFIRLEREKKADSILLEHGDKQEFINAIAKTYIQTYQDQYRFNMNIFTFENPMDNYLDYFIETSTANYYEKEAMYNHFLANSLQRLFDTHPSLKMRMESLGVEKFYINFNIEKDPEFLKDVNKIKNEMNADWLTNAKVFWKENREHNYVFYLNELDKLNKIDYSKMSIENKIKLAYCNIVINNVDYAEEVYTDVLSKYPNNIAALLNRAFIRYGRNDDKCIKDFEKVKKIDYTLTEQINFYIGTFYNNNGDEEAIKKYREAHLKEMTSVIDRQRYFASKGVKAYEENTLEEDKIILIQDKLKDFTCVKGVYYLKLNTGKGLYNNLLLIDLDKSKNEKERMSVMDEMVVFVPTLSDDLIYIDDITFSAFFKGLVKRKKIRNLIKK